MIATVTNRIVIAITAEEPPASAILLELHQMDRVVVQFRIDQPRRADPSFFDRIEDGAHGIAENIARRRVKPDPMGGSQLKQFPRLRQVSGQRLFGVDMLAPHQGFLGDFEMRTDIGQIDDGINVRVVKQGFVAVICPETVIIRDFAHPLGFDIENASNLQFGMRSDGLHVNIEHESTTYESNIHALDRLHEICLK
ncbi:hypothetical protein [Martelella sp. AD-3]|uniref:hypothetical protein n=1 Tax=Martelella sp. AD-3 TaxID=686597 RepID=UPI000466DFD7|nr:hypothetical protein [Martelella sp. AD-3]AMM84548.1 hypothetical protein AZF01_09430 [Martelella sp. AD-3]